MKIKNVSATGAYGFKVDGKLLLVPPGAVVDVPASEQAAVQRLVNKYAEAPDTAIFAMAGASEKAAALDSSASDDEKHARERVLAERAADIDSVAKREDQNRRMAAEKSREAKGDPSDVLRDSRGKPIQIVTEK